MVSGLNLRFSKPALWAASLLVTAAFVFEPVRAEAGEGKGASDGIKVTVSKQNVLITRNKQALLVYRYRDVPFKPYVSKLFSPSGVNILRDAPSDHLHHHGLMYAVCVNGVDFWEEAKAPGWQKHAGFCGVQATEAEDGGYGTFTERLDWVDPAETEVLLKEERTVKVRAPRGWEATFLTWHSEFKPGPGKKKVTLTGSHYHGLGMRFVASMDTKGEFRSSSGTRGKVYRGTERLGKGKWCAYTAEADGKVVTVAAFADPRNVRSPALWFTMTKPFAYISAVLNLHEKELRIEAGEPLVLRYGLALWDGRAATNRIKQARQKWLKWQQGE